MVAMCVLTGYSITTASFAIYEVNEHHSGSKQLQHISGISEPLYWAVNFFYDMVTSSNPHTTGEPNNNLSNVAQNLLLKIVLINVIVRFK